MANQQLWGSDELSNESPKVHNARSYGAGHFTSSYLPASFSHLQQSPPTTPTSPKRPQKLAKKTAKMSGKPIHPATVHFPISFLALSYGLDALYALTPNLPANITSALPVSSDLTRASYYLLSLGLITTLPAVVSGGQQAVALFSRQGMYEADGKTLKLKSKAVIAHALTNDVVLALGTWIWWAKRSAHNESLASSVIGEKAGALLTPEAAYAPQTWQVLLGIATLGLLFFGASIGGALTYNYGVGFAPAGKKPSEKKVD